MSVKKWLMTGAVLAGLVIIASFSGNKKLQSKKGGIISRAKVIGLGMRSGRTGSYSADIEATIYEAFGKNQIYTGKIFVKRPGKKRLEIKEEGSGKEQIIISNGKIRWIYYPGQNTATKVNLEKIEEETGRIFWEGTISDLSWPLFDILQYQSATSLGSEKMDGVKTHILKGTHVAYALQPTSSTPAQVKMWVGEKNGIPRKIVTLSSSDNELMMLLITDVDTEAIISDNKFEFIPPYNTTVKDITNELLGKN